MQLPFIEHLLCARHFSKVASFASHPSIWLCSSDLWLFRSSRITCLMSQQQPGPAKASLPWAVNVDQDPSASQFGLSTTVGNEEVCGGGKYWGKKWPALCPRSDKAGLTFRVSSGGKKMLRGGVVVALGELKVALTVLQTPGARPLLAWQNWGILSFAAGPGEI